MLVARKGRGTGLQHTSVTFLGSHPWADITGVPAPRLLSVALRREMGEAGLSACAEMEWKLR